MKIINLSALALLLSTTATPMLASGASPLARVLRTEAQQHQSPDEGNVHADIARHGARAAAHARRPGGSPLRVETTPARTESAATPVESAPAAPVNHLVEALRRLEERIATLEMAVPGGGSAAGKSIGRKVHFDPQLGGDAAGEMLAGERRVRFSPHLGGDAAGEVMGAEGHPHEPAYVAASARMRAHREAMHGAGAAGARRVSPLVPKPTAAEASGDNLSTASAETGALSPDSMDSGGSVDLSLEAAESEGAESPGPEGAAESPSAAAAADPGRPPLHTGTPTALAAEGGGSLRELRGEGPHVETRHPSLLDRPAASALAAAPLAGEVH